MGKYAALTAMGTFMILNPQKAQAISGGPSLDRGDGSGDGSGDDSAKHLEHAHDAEGMLKPPLHNSAWQRDSQAPREEALQRRRRGHA